MGFIERQVAAAKAKQARVVFPELADARVAEAARRLTGEGICEVLALGEVSEAQVAVLVEARGMKEAMARRLLKKPLYQAAAMVAAGEADAMVAGADSPTRRVIEAAAMAIGLADGVSVPSSFFLMLFPDGRELLFADCAVNVDPDAVALSDIARASERTAKVLLGQANVAMLSFSTGSSGAGGALIWCGRRQNWRASQGRCRRMRR
ncbi:phosphate acyltransferase [Rhodobacteraceae bacterium D3-12]|nr:phosphate acyltransferase [Rhodobacteraceae bacterium D3-12]